MLRLIACDLDGTLLPKGETTLSYTVLDTVRRVSDKGIYFAVCSGRAYYDLKRLFQPVHSRMIYISHDGALAMHRNCVLYKRPLIKSKLEETVSLAAQNCGGVLLSGREHSYCPACNEALYMPLRQMYGACIQKVQNLNAMREDLLKLCFYQYRGSFAVPQGMRIAFDDGTWLELTCAYADKGQALRAVCRRLGIGMEQTAAFGDGENDLPLFAAAGQRYAVAPKCIELLHSADAVITNVTDKIKEWI